MKRLTIITLMLSFVCFIMAKESVVTIGRWEIRLSDNDHFTLLKDGQTVVGPFVPQATYELDGIRYTANTAKCKVRVSQKTGSSILRYHYDHEVSYTYKIDKVVELQQRFYIDDKSGYIGIQTLLSSDQQIRSNGITPVHLVEGYRLFDSDDSNRMLKVPFDNDGFVRYQHLPFGTSVTSHEVTVIYNGSSRKGLVTGAVNHSNWKNGINVVTAKSGIVNQLDLISGVADSETHDLLPHGYVSGYNVASSTFVIGLFEDWRDGMEQFAEAQDQVPRQDWTHGNPIGWQSWGVMSDRNSYDVDIAVADYFHDVLQPAGFCGDDGKIVMSIDSWDNLSGEQKVALCKHCEANNQIAGTYWTPFALWWNEDMLYHNKLDWQDEYLGIDCVLKANGEPIKYDGAYCLDPTHPAVKNRIAKELQQLKARGFKYLKIDFLDNGIFEADSYYDRNIGTGTQAYNEGMHFLCKEADKGEPLYINLSIAPLFPYQYGNSRRIACDTWGKIEQSEYCMNALGSGWWEQGLYAHLDPDHGMLAGNDGEKETLGENRARITSMAITGMVLIADNFSLDDKSGRGDAALSRERAPQILFNDGINEIARIGKAFRPVYGYKEYKGKPGGAESAFYLTEGDTTYLAIFNYSNKSQPIDMDLVAAGIPIGTTATELWSGTPIDIASGRLEYTIGEKDAIVVRIR